MSDAQAWLVFRTRPLLSRRGVAPVTRYAQRSLSTRFIDRNLVCWVLLRTLCPFLANVHAFFSVNAFVRCCLTLLCACPSFLWLLSNSRPRFRSVVLCESLLPASWELLPVCLDRVCHSLGVSNDWCLFGHTLGDSLLPFMGPFGLCLPRG